MQNKGISYDAAQQAIPADRFAPMITGIFMICADARGN
jgi:hypothetical protein